MPPYSVKIAEGSIGNCYLGEGPHWNSTKKEILYVDIFGKAVFRYVPDSKECYKVVVEEGPVSLVVPVEGEPDKYLISVGRNLQVMEWNGKSTKPTSLKTIHSVDDHCKTNRFNDGKCDSEGRIWAGTMGVEHTELGKMDEKKGTLYSFDLKGKVKKHFNEIDISNGLAWTPDNAVMYFIDSFAYRVDAFDYDANSATITNRRTAFDFKANNVVGVPDGMTIDQNGNLWVACFNGQKVLHVDPKVGKQIGQIDFPTRNLTSVTFGGPDLSILYATCAQHFLTKEEIVDQPGAGSLFEVTNVGAKGLSPGFNYKGPI